MSRAPITKSDLQHCLVRKFAFEPVPGSRHEGLSLVIAGRKVASTRFSRGHRGADLDPGLLRQIALQLRLQVEPLQKLYGMVSCSISRDDYIAALRDAGLVD